MKVCVTQFKRCYDCPHCCNDGYNQEKCAHPETRGRKIDKPYDEERIPNWCPLPNAEPQVHPAEAFADASGRAVDDPLVVAMRKYYDEEILENCPRCKTKLESEVFLLARGDERGFKFYCGTTYWLSRREFTVVGIPCKKIERLRMALIELQGEYIVNPDDYKWSLTRIAYALSEVDE